MGHFALSLGPKPRCTGEPARGLTELSGERHARSSLSA